MQNWAHSSLFNRHIFVRSCMAPPKCRTTLSLSLSPNSPRFPFSSLSFIYITQPLTLIFTATLPPLPLPITLHFETSLPFSLSKASMDRRTGYLLAFICLVASVGGESPTAAPAKSPTAATVTTPPAAAPVATPPSKPTTPAPAAAPVATPPAVVAPVSTPPTEAAPVSTPPAAAPVVKTPPAPVSAPPAPVPVSSPPTVSSPVQSPPTPAPVAATPPTVSSPPAEAPVEAPTPSKKKGKKHAAPAPAPELSSPPAPPSEAPGPNSDAFSPGPGSVGDLSVGAEKLMSVQKLLASLAMGGALFGWLLF